MIFRDRGHAGRLLASLLLKYKEEDSIVLALPRGGVPIGAQIANLLEAPLEVLAVRKVGAPFNPELALGAICEDISPVLSESLLAHVGMNHGDVAGIIEAEKKEIHRQIQKFRNGKDLRDLTGKTVIVVDDGLATGATMTAAIRYLKSKHPGKIVAAVPITATSSARKVGAKVNEFVAVEESDDLLAVGHWYENFEPVSDREVVSLLKKCERQRNRSRSLSQKVSVQEQK